MEKQKIIVCVDDEKMVLDVLKMWMVEEFGNDYVIEVAESGEEALEVVEERLENGDEVCLVISDYIMPGMKGDELIVKLHSRTPATLTMMLTGQVVPDAIEAAKRSPNFYCCMAKPWQGDELNNVVNGALAKYFASPDM